MVALEILIRGNISDSNSRSSAQRFFFSLLIFSLLLQTAGSFAWVIHLHQDVI